MKKALICGVSGQDGAYLAQLLLNKGYVVYGGSRDSQMSSFKNLTKLEIKEKVNLLSININDFRSVLQTILKVRPDEIYNLAGQSSVGLSFEQPVETLESISVGTLNLLEAIRFSELPVRFYNAGSSECFGDTGNLAANENTPFRPRSPYGVAKAAAFWQVANYREAYNLHASTGILFNHESPLRPERFVTQKIVSVACRIARGSSEKLVLGNINIARDWGWAPEYVEAMWLMLQQNTPDDYVIATGQTFQLKDFIKCVFDYLNLDWTLHVSCDESLFRPTDIAEGHAQPEKAYKVLGWKAQYAMSDVAKMIVQAKLSSLQ
ncbi:NAD-dependent epimerase/dehydratase family protein [Rudanella paleaurantiibacter]|uniref:GDP-mannose 4,6-dehydratase n=1 Tax=Rudanella paleaurantiibacter TaxID=2614655 RepID=A0A7J5TXQ0_9BACT|nr:GDP-mannose 4,6-dehydratase [Rudanella paleaurantiibacter]KAB7729357.1 NAD-dependent epimerase/dehydratase family protein [Rudanella paleaurantiibacter]